MSESPLVTAMKGCASGIFMLMTIREASASPFVDAALGDLIKGYNAAAQSLEDELLPTALDRLWEYIKDEPLIRDRRGWQLGANDE